MDVSWFDQKYQNGKKPSLADKQELFAQSVREIGLSIPRRGKEKIEEVIKSLLFQLKGDYSPGIETLAHGYIFCFAPVIGLDIDKIRDYRRKYNEYTKKHQEKIPFERNFDEAEKED